MRAALLHAWPGLSHHFGLHPWDTPRLSSAEWDQYLDALDQINRAAGKK